MRRVLSTAVIAMLAACGGGGSSSTSSTTPPPVTATLTGTAAAGAPMSGATITVTAADGTTKTVTAGTDGGYTVDVTGLAGPLVIAASGKVGETEEELVSLTPTVATATVNVNPITHAIAATIASTGNPYDLAGNIAAEKTNITTAKVDASEQAFRAALGDVMTAVGASGNLLNTAFVANGTSAMDKLLDNVKVEVRPGGGITLQTSGGVEADDQGDTTTVPAAAKALTIAPGALPTATDKAQLPAPTAAVGAGELAPIRDALNTCFAGTPASRGTFTALGSQCTGLAPLVATNYLHQGRNGSQEFNGYLADSSMSAAQFALPEIIRPLSATRVLAKFAFLKTNGFLGSFVSVADKATGSWQLVGNQRQFEVFVNGFVQQRDQVTNATNLNRFTRTGVNLFVRNNPTFFPNDNNLTGVTVYGPGLPGFVDWTSPGTGKTLVKVAGCDYWTFAVTACGSLWGLQMYDNTGAQVAWSSISTSFQTFSANPQMTDAEVLTIQPGTLYKFVLTTTGGTLTYWDRLRSRPYISTEISKVTFLQFSATTRDMVNSATASWFNGGGKPTIAWTQPIGAAPAYLTTFYQGNQSDMLRIKLSDRQATIACTQPNPNCDTVTVGNYLSPINFGTAPVIDMFQLVARNRFDTQVFTQVKN